MSRKKLYLASDDWSPVHPLVLQAISEANEGYAPSYGSDLWTEEAQKLIQENFKTPCKVFVVPTGTGANIFGLKLACRSHESIICTDISNIHSQESGAAEPLIGCKLLTVSHKEGKITPESILKKLKVERAFGKHSTSSRTLSIAQPTEVGTVYSIEELSKLSKLCKVKKIASIIKTIPNLFLSYSVETNQIFFTAPKSWIPLIQDKIFYYPWDQEKNEIRFITSWNTSEQDIRDIESILIKISNTTGQ